MFKQVSSAVNFIDLEHKISKYWEERQIVKKYLSKNKRSTKYFSFLDGPITANNPMGVHHAWGRTYKDLFQKYQNLKGKKQRFQNGFDCQGLWVEVEVEKELGFRTKKDIEKYGVSSFVDKCKERVNKYAAIQTQQSKRLGYFMDWDHSYFTMSDENNYMIWHFLKTCFTNGWIYKGEESVPWCPRCETAISQHEMLTEDYKEVTHESVYFKLPLINREKEFLLVWTTTPWTLIANIAVAVDEKLDYALVKVDSGEKLWLCQSSVDKVIKDKQKIILKVVKGSKLVGLKYLAPFDHLEGVKKVSDKYPAKFHSVIPTDDQIMPITITEGTGLVHTAVSAGTEDFQLGKKYGLPMIPVISDNADYLPGFGEFSGKNAKKNPRIILDFLSSAWVYLIEKYKHRYPACWRCKTELVWKVADEWYIAMDKSPLQTQNLTLRERMIGVANKIKWLPDFGLDRELDWLKNMHDWLISKKNRYWGLALPIYQCPKCRYFEVIGSREELKERAVAGWEKFAGHSPHKPWIDEVKIKCSKCNSIVTRIPDVGNPWLDAGIVAFSTISENNFSKPLYLTDKDEWGKWYPADIITESFPGQFKNWFYSLIAMASVLENSPPFKTVLGFATLLDEKEKPMHKSWGNMIEFNEGAERIGVDVMRWMYVRQNPYSNLLFGYKIADEVRRKFHLILWNTYNYFVTYANLFNFQTNDAKSNNILDKWIILRLNNVLHQVSLSLDNFDAFTASGVLEEFVSDLSTWYIRRSRGRVGWEADTTDRNYFLTTLYKVLVDLSVLLSPFLPFISEEIYMNLTNNESVHLADYPNKRDQVIDSELENEMRIVRQLTENFHSLRKSKNIKLRIPVKKAAYLYTSRLPKELETVLKDELNIKQLNFKKDTGTNYWQVSFSNDNLLLKEGEAREIIRKIQNLRKEQKLSLLDKIEVELPDFPQEYESYIKEKTLTVSLKKGTGLSIRKIS